MDSTARLVRSDASHVNLALQLLPAGQCDMQEDNPIACHLKRKMSLIAARSDFLGFPENRRHARVRHVCLQRNMRSGYCSRRRIGQPEGHHNRADPDRFWRDFVFNRDPGFRVGRSGTSGQSPRANESKQQKLLPPFRDQTACIEGLWPHSQVQAILPCSLSGGNMW
jgi:hypothetical protein